MSEWISVDDRFPHSSKVVLAWDYDEVMLARCIPSPYLPAVYKWRKPQNCQSYDGRDDNVLTNVTHWQPLPDPPNSKR